jgi:hypothetical protein
VTPAAKAALLQAFDALVAVSSARPPPVHHSPKGGSVACDYCGKLLSDGDHDAPGTTCPIGQATLALLPLVPRADEREAWLADPALPEGQST